jgi:hypothetical protein
VNRLERVAVTIGYAVSLLPALWRTELGPIVLAALLGPGSAASDRLAHICLTVSLTLHIVRP